MKNTWPTDTSTDPIPSTTILAPIDACIKGMESCARKWTDNSNPPKRKMNKNR
jgi:hypothetical protein